MQLEIPAAISNGSVTKAGTGTLRLSGVQTYASLLAQAGTVDLETAVGTGASSVTVAPTSGSATVNFNESQRLTSLTIGNGGIVNLNEHNPSSNGGYDSQLFAKDSGANISALAHGASQGVPEPGSLSLMIVSSLFLLRRRKRS